MSQDSPAAPAPSTTPAPAPTTPGPRRTEPDKPQHGHGGGHGNARMWALVVGALGVVFGDIGTSPLYTLKECMHEIVEGGGAVARDEVLDVLSLIFWSLTLVVSVKYLLFILKADNKGEGGILALLALVPERLRASGPTETRIPWVALLVLIGAALLYGDGAITPAISVLSAIEGVRVAQPDLTQGTVIFTTVVILAGLFAIQRQGTALIGVLFGPVMIVWFATLGVLGIWHIVQRPEVLEALSPHHALSYFAHHGVHGIGILGSVVLAVTGGEALYADMGHFGRAPIQRAWLLFVMPALVLNYFGQGALLLEKPEAAENPFFALAPGGLATYALVALSSFATIIASQALISGAFSLTRQAMQLGFFPRVTIRHTASEQEGQIYIPEVNSFLAVACIALVLTFKESSALAAAYGIAVTGTMAITSVVYFVVLRTARGWSLARAIPVLLLFLAFDLPFLGANVAKFLDGGYVPVAIAFAIVIVMVVWHHGRKLLAAQYLGRYRSFEETWPALERSIATRTPGTGVFMASSDKGLPPILAHHVERTRALHKQILLLTVVTADRPTVPLSERVVVDDVGHGFWRIHVYYGFMEQPDVPRALKLALVRKELDFDLRSCTYYLARERVLGSGDGEMSAPTERLFGFLQRNAVNADRYFRIPHEQVIEVGQQIDL